MQRRAERLIAGIVFIALGGIAVQAQDNSKPPEVTRAKDAAPLPGTAGDRRATCRRTACRGRCRFAPPEAGQSNAALARRSRTRHCLPRRSEAEHR